MLRNPTEFKDKKIVIVAVPGAFTPTCSEKHVPTFIEQKDALKAKGVDHVIVIAYNDPFVMSAWGKSNGIKDDFIVRNTSSYHALYLAFNVGISIPSRCTYTSWRDVD